VEYLKSFKAWQYSVASKYLKNCLFLVSLERGNAQNFVSIHIPVIFTEKLGKSENPFLGRNFSNLQSFLRKENSSRFSPFHICFLYEIFGKSACFQNFFANESNLNCREPTTEIKQQ
jgi:hypothetical protein